MKEYAELGHLKPVNQPDKAPTSEHAYLPHHAVINESSVTTKLRVVFDGSVPSSTGISLNNRLCVGPKVQRDLFPILISFRTYEIAIVADIKQMFRQILVSDQDRDYQRIVWRRDFSEPLQHCQLNTVTYGTSAAPFLATRSLNQVAEEFRENCPLGAKAIKENFYVDDFLGGADSLEIARKLYQELTYALSTRGFPLHKWSSNSVEFLTLTGEDVAPNPIRIEGQAESIKVLGLRWKADTDCFGIDVNPSDIETPTKRLILSETGKIFDPLGLVAPVTIVFKIMLQQLWLENYDWDEPIRDTLLSKWISIHSNLHKLTQLQIPRWLHTSSECYELHGFADASESAHAAVVYCRVVSHNQTASITLVAAKTRVAPINRISVPRLELNAAHLLSRLMHAIKTSLNKPELTCVAWTDSKIVLGWLSSHPCYWKSFVANRTSEILSILPRSAWHHVNSQDNPADLASRGVRPQDLIDSSLWWNGPAYLASDWRSYLHDDVDETSLSHRERIKAERRPQIFQTFPIVIQNDTLSDLFRDKSSLMRILYILGRCIQFIKCCRQPRAVGEGRWLTSEELNSAMLVCLKWTQRCCFSDEVTALQKNRNVSSSSNLRSLSPFLDKEGVLRVGGRLERSNCSYETKHPVILPKEHQFVKLLITYLHEKHLHVGTNGLLSIIRQRYWILCCRTLVKGCINACVKCVRQRASTSRQLMANLPPSRTSFTRAFENIGVDYGGPFTMLRQLGRGARTCKGYVALFTCLSTRAIHLEVASDLPSEAFLACLKRFIARRGVPNNVYSDNGTNFGGANRKLCELYKLITSKEHKSILSERSAPYKITWKFNPPAAPHFGGSWESGIKLVKKHLRRTIGEARLTYEEFSTVLVQIEGVLNSRPLTAVSEDIDCFDVLTPGHFLIGQPLVALPEDPREDNRVSFASRWKMLQSMYGHFWARWYKEYLVTLQHRPKWTREETNINVGDLVLLRENNMPPSSWALGRVIALHPGKDNLVRVVTVRTSNGELKRPVVKLCRLPLVKTQPLLSSLFVDQKKTPSARYIRLSLRTEGNFTLDCHRQS